MTHGASYKGHTVIGSPPRGFRAQHGGTCVECHGAIQQGEFIRATGDGYMHADPGRCAWFNEHPEQRVTTFTPKGTQASESWHEGLPNGVWTIAGPRGHRTFRIVTVQADPHAEHGDGDESFRTRHAGKRVLELLVGPDNTKNYKGLAWYPGKIGKLWKLGQTNEVLVNVFAKLVERGETLEGYEVQFAANCQKCNRLLTVPSSINARYGPVCVKGGWDS